MRTIEITSYIGCPNNCGYCPQSLLLKSYKGKNEMTLEDFRLILRNTPKDVRIDFSGFSEIFFHPQGSQFIYTASDHGYRIVLYTTLEGFMDEDIDILQGIQFDDVCFHKWPGVNEDEFDDKREKFEKYIQQGRVAVIDDKWKWSRAGNVWRRKKINGKFQCLFAGKNFDRNVVIPNGNVYLCCQDYGLTTPLGNLYTTNFNDLDRGMIIGASYSEKDECLCRSCELMQPE